MSLNGLDAAKVTEAYQAALSEAGGWFLLKYASRDEVETLNRGTGGLAEARRAVVEYTEKSPLYGFLLYRRRKVLIKYIPEGTSRLLQARVTVHFLEITERFSPQDTILSITSPNELNDTTLTKACSLHTAAASSCSSSGSTRGGPKLDEITEDAEEGQGANDDDITSLAPTEPQKSEIDGVSTATDEPPKTPKGKDAMSETLSSQDPHSPEYALSVASLKNYEYLLHPSEDRRLSSQTVRPTASELYSLYGIKPKVKLGPRPKAIPDADKRPHTSGNGASKSSHAVSSLPAGLRVAPRKSAVTSRPKSRNSSAVPSIAVPPPPPIPSIPDISARPTTSPSSVKSMPVVTQKPPGMTPEKKRLMKALELRKKQMSAAQEKKDLLDVPKEVDSEETGQDEQEEEPETTPASKDEEVQEPAKPETAPLDNETSDVEQAMSDSTVEAAGTEAEYEQSLGTTSSPTSGKLMSEISTPPSSISGREEDSELTPEVKPFEFEPEVDEDGDASAVGKQRESVESSPTVVPDNASPVPSVEVSSAGNAELIAASNDSKGPSPSNRNSALTQDGSTGSAKSNRSSMTKSKRKQLMQPIRIDISADHSDAGYSSDDSFMDELQSATVEEAKPMSVSKSPIKPFFPRASTASPLRPASPGFLSSEQFSAPPRRSFSGPFSSQPAEGVAVAKKINVSSGISQRIKALAENSKRESSASLSPVVTPESGTSIVAMRKSSLRTPPNGPSPTHTPKHAKKWSRGSIISFTNLQPESTVPELKKTILQPPTDSVETVYNIRQQQDRPESVSVTARIVRDARTEKPALVPPTETSPLELHQSPITIDHQRSKTDLSKPESTSATLSKPSSRESMHQALPRSSSESNWRSFGRRNSGTKSPPGSARSLSGSSLDGYDDEKEDKKKSRTSRLFKRMSSTISLTTRKSIAQVVGGSLKEETSSYTTLPSLREPPPAVQVGDLNVQLPDTLLWKRRWVEVDGQGNIVMTLSKANEHPRGVVKRFHLAEFHPPYAPDHDRQELPYSIILDFLDGRTLQCACESYMAQMHVLQILKEAHDAWIAYGQ